MKKKSTSYRGWFFEPVLTMGFMRKEIWVHSFSKSLIAGSVEDSASNECDPFTLGIGSSGLLLCRFLEKAHP